MQAVDAQMLWWMPRSGKRVEAILPIATRFVAEMMRPLFDKIDTVQFTQMARILKVGQDYAVRLLLRNYPEDKAEEIAATLTKNYPDHGFVIDSDEAKRINLEVEEPPAEIARFVSPLGMAFRKGTILGPLKELKNAQPNDKEPTDKQPRPQRRGRGARNRNGKAGPAQPLGSDSEATIS